jgi:hypothetical protein
MKKRGCLKRALSFVFLVIEPIPRPLPLTLREGV